MIVTTRVARYLVQARCMCGGDALRVPGDVEAPLRTRGRNPWCADARTPYAICALADGDEDEARQQLGRIAPATLSRGDAERYRLVRDSLAGSEGDPTLRLIDRRWISHLVLAGVLHALEADGVVSAIRGHPEADALRRVAEGEAAVIAAARAHYPMFDRAHQESMGTWDRMAVLFE